MDINMYKKVQQTNVHKSEKCKFNKRSLVKTGIFLFFFLSLTTVYSQAYTSTQAHEDRVNAIFPFETSTNSDTSFYSAGNDGFIIKWSPNDGMGEHYQISDLQIQKVVRNPATGDIAVYETDGVSTHRVAVVDSKSFAKRYTKRFANSVTSLSFSEKGTHLIVGTAAVNGTFIINARTGTITKRTNDVSGIVTMAKTGESEKRAVLYSPTGSLIYYDLSTMKQIKKLSTENMLEQPMIFGTGKVKDRFFAGVKDNVIFLIDATNGKILAQYPAKDPFIFAAKSAHEEGFYFTTNSGKSYSLKTITDEMLIKQIGATGMQTLNPPTPLVVKNFIGLRSRDSFTCAAKNSGSIILGTQSGNIYTMTSVPESETYTLFPMTEKMYERIYDIDTNKSDFYLLTASTIYKSSFDSRQVDRIGGNTAQTNILSYADDVILWSKGERKPVQRVSDGQTSILFSPTTSLQNMRVFGDKLVYIQGNSSVGLFNLSNGNNQEIYSGTSIQDAIMYDENYLYVAKTSTGGTDSPLISVNIHTKETVPLKMPGNVAFSLSYDYDSSRKNVYGVIIRPETQGEGNVTEVFSYNPATKVLNTLLRLADEDTTAFTTLHYPYVYTNLGKNQVYACNVETKKNMLYRRSASMPIKMVRSGNRIAILNRNGSISWYTSTSQAITADWYLTVDGDWFEF